MAGLLAGRIAVVTGASSGIGAETAVLYAGEGASVALLARREDRLKEIAERARDAGGDAETFVCDVTNADDITAACAAITARFGERVHVLFNNAGGAIGAGFPNEEVRAWNTTIALNLTSTLLMTQTLWPALCKEGASVINMSSYAAVTGGGPAAAKLLAFVPPAAYAASKAGVEALTRYFAHIGSPHGVRSNAVRPGQIDTDLARFGDQHFAHDYFESVQMTPGAGTALDVAGVALFLATEHSRFVNGEVINVDGGASGKV